MTLTLHIFGAIYRCSSPALCSLINPELQHVAHSCKLLRTNLKRLRLGTNSKTPVNQHSSNKHIIDYIKRCFTLSPAIVLPVETFLKAVKKSQRLQINLQSDS